MPYPSIAFVGRNRAAIGKRPHQKQDRNRGAERQPHRSIGERGGAHCTFHASAANREPTARIGSAVALVVMIFFGFIFNRIHQRIGQP